MSVPRQESAVAGRPGLATAATEVGLKAPAASVETFTRELANLLAAGLPLSKALSLLEREASQPAAQKVWAQIRSDVVGGAPLAEAISRHPRTFSTVYVAMVRAGEAGGFLHLVLEQIAEFRTREQDLKGKVKAALIYPAVLSVVASGVMVFLLTFFIPRFSKIFSGFGGQLPALTQAIVGISDVMVKYWAAILVAVAVLVVIIQRTLSTQEGRRTLERVILRTPAVGKVAARFALVRFSRMLGTLIGAGVPLVQSLRVSKAALGNETLAEAVDRGIEEVEDGASLSRSFRECPLLFPNSVIEMLAVAEETGRLDKELKRLSTSFEGDLDRRLRMLVALVEPLLLFLMAGLIGAVVVGMLLPLFTLQDLVH